MEAPAPVADDPNALVQVSADYWQDRAAHPTHLTSRGPSPQPWHPEELPAEIEAVQFPSAVGPLKGWLWRPRGGGVHPAVVFFHGGLSWAVQDIRDCAPFVEAGYTVFTPTYRGENGNPGIHEAYFGEVDDAVAAVRWLAGRAEVDSRQIFTFGHSAGGVISGLISLVPDVPVVKTGSAGGIYPEQALSGAEDGHPFDVTDARERRLRGFVHYLSSMRRPHSAWVGRDDVYLAQWVPALEDSVRVAGAPLVVRVLDGDHHSSLAPAMRAFIEEIAPRPVQTTVGPAAEARVRAITEPDTEAVYRHPEHRRRVMEVLNTPAIRRELDEAERIGPEQRRAVFTQVATTIGQATARAGLQRLPIAELREWNRLVRALAQSEAACVGFWIGNLDMERLMVALAQLTDADLRSWARTTTHASMLELEATSPVTTDATAFAEGMAALAARLPPDERAAFHAGVAADPLTQPAAACGSYRRILSASAAMSPDLEERYLRALAAQ